MYYNCFCFTMYCTEFKSDKMMKLIADERRAGILLLILNQIKNE